jgi:hypothetical protein
MHQAAVETKKPDPFLSIFGKTGEMFILSGGLTKVYDFEPPEITDPQPVIYACGWNSTPTGSIHDLKRIYNSGRRVLSIEYNRPGVPMPDSPHHPNFSSNAQAMVDVIQAKGLKNVAAIGHSKGVPETLIAAETLLQTMGEITINPIVAINSTGIPNDDFFSLIARYLSIVWDQHTKEKYTSSKARPASDVFRTVGHNVQLAIEDGKACATANVLALMKALRDKGTVISVVAGTNDRLFPLTRLSAEGKLASITHGVYTIDGGHETATGVTEEAYINVALHALTNAQRILRAVPTYSST